MATESPPTRSPDTRPAPAAAGNGLASPDTGHRARSGFAIEVPDTLLARARRGERAAFEQLYRWFERPAFTLALRICGDREEAFEVLQDTMLKMIARIGEFRGSSPFWGWLRQIAVNEALMRLRKARRFDDALDIDDQQIAGEVPPPSTAADVARMQQALSALPAVTRSVLWLYHAEGYTHEEIATLMRRTPSFSKSQVARGTRRLRALLEPAADPVPESTHA